MAGGGVAGAVVGAGACWAMAVVAAAAAAAAAAFTNSRRCIFAVVRLSPLRLAEPSSLRQRQF